MGRLARPIPKLGPGKAQWLSHHARSRELVRRRANGKCEGCGRADAALDWAHVMGRGHLIAEPWCSSPELTMGLCRECHRAVDGDLGGTNKTLRERLRWTAFERLCQATHHWQWVAVARPQFGNGLNATRALVDVLEREQQEEVVDR